MILDSLSELFEYSKRDKYSISDAEWEEEKLNRDLKGRFSSNDEKTNDEWRKEIKEHLADVKNKDIVNKSTGVIAQLASEGINKMTSGAAIKKSVDNGFTTKQHFEAVKNIVDLYKKAKLVKTHADKNGDKNVTMKRFVAQDEMKDGTKFDALITLKESVEHGHRIYSLELDEINKAAQRWTVNDDGTLTPLSKKLVDKPSTGNLNKIYHTLLNKSNRLQGVINND